MPIKSLDEFSKSLDQLAKDAKDVPQTRSVSMGETLTPEFVSKHTRFANADELFKAGGFNASNQAEFEAVAEDRLDAFIRSESPFASWREMLHAAGIEWAKLKLGL